MQKAYDYPLLEMVIIRHVAEVLEGVGSSDPAFSVSDLLVGFNPLGSDVYRVRENEKLSSDRAAKEWMIQYAIFLLGDQVHQDGDGYRLAVSYDKLKVDGKKVPRTAADATFEEERLNSLRVAYAYMSDPNHIPTYKGGGGKAYGVHDKARALDRMPFDKFCDLAYAIEQNGLRQPIIVHKASGKIVDGVHRAAACEAIGKPVRIREMEGDDQSELAIVDLIMDLNVNRRESAGSKDKIGALILTWYKEEAARIAALNHLQASAKGGKGKGKADLPYPSENPYEGKQAAAIALDLSGVKKDVISERSLRDMEWVEKHAPETFEKAKTVGFGSVAKAKEAAKKEFEAKQGETPPPVPPSQSELAKTARKRFGDANACLRGGIKLLQAGRIGGTVKKPLTEQDWEDIFWEHDALVADFKTHIKFLYEGEIG